MVLLRFSLSCISPIRWLNMCLCECILHRAFNGYGSRSISLKQYCCTSKVERGRLRAIENRRRLQTTQHNFRHFLEHTEHCRNKPTNKIEFVEGKIDWYFIVKSNEIARSSIQSNNARQPNNKTRTEHIFLKYIKEA